jgi:hypothetical protein
LHAAAAQHPQQKELCRRGSVEIRKLSTARILLHFNRSFTMSTAHRFLSVSLLLVALALVSLAPDTASAQDRRVRIINAGNVTVNSFYASNTNRQSWEEDILGNSVLAPGQSVMVNINDGTGACMFDFRAVLANGRKVESYGMNVCQISSWTVR